MAFRALAVLGILLASGCMQPELPAGSPELGPSLGAWTHQTASWVAAASWGCGFCVGDLDTPEFHAVAVDGDGQVLAVDYAQAARRNGSAQPVQRLGLEPLAPALDSLFASGIFYGAAIDAAQPDKPVQVLGAATGQLGTGPWAQVLAGIQADLRHPGDDGSGDAVTFTDCGPEILLGLLANASAQSARSGCGVEPGAGWQHVSAQLHALDAWVREAGDGAFALPDGSLVPALAPDAPAPATRGAQPTLVAAFLARACGGLAAGCSGASGMAVYSDRAVVAFWGSPWAPQHEGMTSCLGQEDRLAALSALGDGWRVPCAAVDAQGQAVGPRAGAIPPGAWEDILASLRKAGPGPVPRPMQETPCCDRIFTDVRVALDGHADHVQREGTGLPPPDAPESAFVHPYAQLLALRQWTAPTRGDWASTSA